MAEIRYLVDDWTKFQLVVLKLLIVVSCEEGGFVFWSVGESFCFVGQGSMPCGECIVVLGMVPKVVREMAEIQDVLG